MTDERIAVAVRLVALVAAHPGEYTAWTAGKALKAKGLVSSEQQVVNVVTAISYDVPELAEDEGRKLHWIDD